MEKKTKNVKISSNHHELLKNYCDKKGMKIYKVLEKMIEDLTKPKKTDIYGED
jgi:hypothetical protein